MNNGDSVRALNTYRISEEGRLVLLESKPLSPKRSYVKRGLTASNKSRPYQNARRRALQALKERHESEFEALFAEELKWYLG